MPDKESGRGAKEGARLEEGEAGMTEDTEGWLEMPSSYAETLSTFCSMTTIHGAVRLICTEGNRMKTSLWAAILALTLGAMYWQIGLICRQYLQFPVQISLSIHSGNIQFPTVTVCTLNPYRYKEVSADLRELDLLTQEALFVLYGYRAPGDEAPTPPTQRPRAAIPRRLGLRLINPEGRRGSPALEIRPRRGRGGGEGDAWAHSPPLARNSSWKIGFELCNSTGGDCFYNWHSSGVDALREWYTFHYVNLMAHISLAASPLDEAKMGEFVQDCRFNGFACRESFDKSFHHPVYGNCYTFNGINSSSQWESSKAGKDHGLSLVLRIEQNNSIPFLSTAAGARMMVHDRGRSPFMEDGGFDIRPGLETSVSMRKEVVSRLGGPYSDCTENGSDVRVRNLYKSDYTQQTCVRSCFQLTMVSRCGCAYYYYPLPAGAEYCNYNKHIAWGHCYYRLAQEFTDDVLGCFKTCRKPCKQTEYQMTAGYANWPSKNSMSWMNPLFQKKNHSTPSNSRKELAKLNLFFRELNYKSMRETPAMPVALMLANLGSQWSLWLGSSVMSVLEMVELAFDLIALAAILLWTRPPGPSAEDTAHPPDPVPHDPPSFL
ncbi:amiloride-sensitive sodium channel subunit alpha-like isoform X1 [Stegostoma tigrinum]|uniref:amiloride-sensitive sodium channel subunit alpha-like isoform X1 n=1 Tax=Stegostoma tigrinum TaxID=3053191 RepID=UPI00202B16E0|nr:amiloride-sensitive sodium channel subunit alpha-like isoform X1 [Stegostoma tigrinum]XP_048380578.1 amiloride-sensitive sodium channel subunit alpha-like isoform X1 [Stegostoma tigrinum]